MTPTTSTIRSTITPILADRPSELAAQPLIFTPERQCKNKPVMAAVIDALSDQSRSDQCVAAILKNAFRHGYQTELNQLIKNIKTQQGTDTVEINQHVARLLSEDKITLTRNSDGTVHLEKAITTVPDSDRHESIHQALIPILPIALCDLIGSYDDEIEIGEENETEIMDSLKSNDLQAKVNIIAAASHQDEIAYLNGIFQTLRDQKFKLDLSHADLSNLNLQEINLDFADLSHANMNGCNLSRASLQHANLTHATLDGASLRESELSQANLTDARLISANLSGANLFLAVLVRAQLKFANLSGTEMNSVELTSAVLDYANLKNVDLSHAVLSNASLTHAQLYDAPLVGANLSNAKMVAAKLIRSNLSGANLTSTDLTDASFEEVNLRGETNLTATVWEGVHAKKIYADWQTRKALPTRFWSKCI